MPSETAYGARCHDHALWPDCRFKLTSHKVTDFRGVDPPEIRHSFLESA